MDNFTPGMSEKLVQYLDGELGTVEKNSLEQAIASDIKLQEELESLRYTREAIKLYGLKQKVGGIHQQMMSELATPVKKINSSTKILRYSMRIAASLLLLVAAYAGYNFFTLSPEKVFSSNYHSYELDAIRSNDTMKLSDVENFYLEKQYAKVVSVSANTPFTSKENFLRGMSYIELNNNASAITEFKKVIAENPDSKNSLLKSEAEYYLALTYIRNKNYSASLELLNKIKENPGHLYYEKISAKLIRQVKMLKMR